MIVKISLKKKGIKLKHIVISFYNKYHLKMNKETPTNASKEYLESKTGPSGAKGDAGTKMSSTDASRIQGAADRNPASDTSQTGFKERAQRAADPKK